MVEVLRLVEVELELSIDRHCPISLTKPAGRPAPAVVLRMPAYTAAGLAHVVDQWAGIRGLLDRATTGWEPAARRLLRAARQAVPIDAYPELDDLRYCSLLHARPGHQIGPVVELEVAVDRERLIRVEDPAGGALQPAIVARMPPHTAATLAHLIDQRVAIAMLLDDQGEDEVPMDEWLSAARAFLAAARHAVGKETAYPELDGLLRRPLLATAGRVALAWAGIR
ncbi:hypothetical protein I6A84_27225 [Frankia sp. CNm7]|uniref:Uncharacterized protein n=1 Tax=Frankia nepalensis TaxID=1836974 RepID=A0A937R957_9ACTN|nr:hypothetical protein [Frankia nepalensis]MBL7495461.1 hypothetical protein [Frankia nepalensis]MBL7510198.1 hypothetical protein [Frankia nepalensis]MBL7521671.1 hypothetical protein [Frankia nepalensis]MBL7626017.1 hypothetical protein [Frankia nepalensis]